MSTFKAPIHHILVATEDYPLLGTICSALDGEPFLVGLVNSRTELLSDGYAGTCDIVMVDEAIGAIDGWRFTSDLRAAAGSRKIVIIGIVSVLDAATLGRQRELGLDGFVRKAGMERKLADGIQILTRNVPPRPSQPSELYLPSADLATSVFEAATDELTSDWSTNDVEAQVAQSASPKPEQAAAAGAQAVQELDPEVLKAAKATQKARETRKHARATAGNAPDLSGSTMGKVKLLKIIGSGAGGTVYQGLHTNLDMPVAVKVLHAELVRTDSDYAMRFLREARIAARVSHANVVRVFDCDRDDQGTGAYYIIMEFVKGRSLEKEVSTHGKINEERLVGIAIGVAQALVAAEEEGVIHRDIKPGNIMLYQDDAVKVTDLGLAQPAQPLSGLGASNALGSNKLGKQANISNPTIMGTPYYMSPEQITDPSKIDVRSDIYSLGATLYFASTGEVPFPGENVADVLLHHLETTPITPHEREPSITPAFSKLIMKMLEKKPDKRPAGHRDVLSILRDHRQDLIDEKRSKKDNPVVRFARRVTGKW